MKTFTTLIALALTACGGNLDIGNGPERGDSGGSDPGVSGSGSCSASGCSGYTITCSSGQPTNLQCVPDNTISGCTLTGQCTDTSATQTCTYTPPPCSPNVPCGSGAPGGGNGEIDLTSDPTTMATTLAVNFGYSSAQAIGDCQYQPSGLGEPGYVNGQPLANEGTVTASAAGFSLSATPLCDGTYPNATTSQLLDRGAVVSFDWAGASHEPKPTFPSVPGPHAINVAQPGALSASGTTLLRANDVSLGWTPLDTPLSLEQVGFELLQGSKRLECRFSASAKAGTVPADALLEFAGGSAQFSVFSLHASPASDGFVNPTFIVMRQATFLDGTVVKGTLTLQ